MNMEESNFSSQLHAALNQKLNWFNEVRLQELLGQYRLMHTCVHNIYDTFIKKNIIIPDPYRLDKKIDKIILPETSLFTENDLPKIFGARFSDYETMLDYICTYFRFTVENLPIPTIKQLLDFNKVIDWENVTTNNPKMNTRALALSMASAKMGAAGVIQSMLNDSVSKCSKCANEINVMLNELGVFQRELYKGDVRQEIFQHPEFNAAKAMESPEAEMAEIKKLYPKVIGKKTFYNDLINEIIEEDQGADKEKRQAAVFERIKIKTAQKVEAKKKDVPSTKDLLMQTVLAIGATAPTLGQLKEKLKENFDLLFAKKKTLFSKFIEALKKALHFSEKAKIIQISIKDPKTGLEHQQKLDVAGFMDDLVRKEHVYSGIGTKGPEYEKVGSSNEEAILQFVNKQISELQSTFTMINALDVYFKNQVEELHKGHVKGMQIELSALRNSIINANKKRGDYANFKEESEQMKKLGITENA